MEGNLYRIFLETPDERYLYTDVRAKDMETALKNCIHENEDDELVKIEDYGPVEEITEDTPCRGGIYRETEGE